MADTNIHLGEKNLLKQSNYGGNLLYYSQKYNIPRSLLLDFSANINPLGPPGKAMDKIAANLNSIKDYPEPDSETMLKKISEQLNVKKESMIAGNGATELLFLLLNHLRPGKAFIPAPTFSEYEMAARSVNAEIRYIPFLNDFQDLDLSFVNDLNNNDIVFLCNPNNPTGTLFTRDKVLEIIELTSEKGAFLLLDESFTDFIEDSVSLRDKIAEGENLVILYSLTKIFAIPGLRLGLLLGNPDIIQSLYLLKDPWNVNILAQIIGEELLSDQEFLDNTKNYFKNEKDRFVFELSGIESLKIYNQSADFIFIKILNEATVEELQEALIQDKIMIRNCSNYIGLSNKYFRVAIKSKEENDRLVYALKSFFE